MRHASLTLAALVVTSLCPAASRAQEAPSAVVGEGRFDARLTLEPERIVLGRVDRVIVRVEAPEPDGPLRPLRASVNVGSLGEVRRTAPGRYEIDYTPPKPRYPQVAILAVWRETGPEAPVAFFRVPLLGTARVPVETVPRAKITVKVAGETFGPFRANRRGRAVVRLVAPPGVPRATITAVDARGKKTSARLDLDVPPYNRLTLAVVPHTIIADGHGEARLHVYYDTFGGRPPKARDLRIEAPVGKVGPVRAERGPVFGASYTAPPGTPDQTVTFAASVAGDRKSGAQAAITLGRQVPARVEVDVTPDRLVADGVREARVRVVVLDRLGLGVPGATPALSFEGAPVEAAPLEDRGKGLYTARFVPARLGPEAPDEVRLEVRAAVGGLKAVRPMVLLPRRAKTLTLAPRDIRLVADGSAAAVLTVRVKDLEGRPLADLEPTVAARFGRAEVAGRDGDGWRIRYRAPELRVRQPAGAPRPAGRDDEIVVHAGGLEDRAVVHLAPVVDAAHPMRAFAEAVGGYATNLGVLSGPSLGLNLGVDVLGAPHFGLTLGVAWSASFRRGELALPDGVSGEARTAQVRLVTAPILGEVRFTWRGEHVSIGLGADAGLVLTPGDVYLPGSGQLPVNDGLFAFGGRLSLGVRAGPGSVVLEGAWVHAVRGASGAGIDVTGSMAGPAASVGYRLEL